MNMKIKEGELKMKKLLVLLMVLGLATSAQAVLSLSLDGQEAPDEITIAPSTTVLIDIHSSDQSFYDALLFIVDDGAAPGDPSLNGEWVPPASVWGIGNVGAYEQVTPEFWSLNVGSTAVPNDVVAGKQFEVAFHCKALGDVTIYLTDNDLVTIDSMIVHQIPEPMTLALLGLGGLFLRRRK